MAMTATIALNPTTIVAQGSTQGGPGSAVTVTVSNSAGVPVNVLGIRPIVYDHGTTQSAESVNTDRCVVSPSNQSVPATGSATFNFNVMPFQLAAALDGYPGSWPSGTPPGAPPQTNVTQDQYDVTCEILCADGTVIYPTVAVLTVNPTPHSKGAGEP